VSVRIEPLGSQGAQTRHAVAVLLLDAFAAWPESWKTLAEAAQEVEASLADDRVSFVALGEDGAPVGWIAGIESYRGRVWELHPLAVAPGLQRTGIGRRLVERLEREVAARGALTVYLGTDDVTGMTSLGGRNLYPGVLANVARIENLRDHPYGFYQRLGYEVVGVVPDANGPGRPDIMMAKRVGPGTLAEAASPPSSRGRLDT
jgi:aminoglycoside 6'-N-acetyltransferase I